MAARIDGIRCGIMNLARTSLTLRARWAAPLALSTLVLTTACGGDGGGDTDTDSGASATDASAGTDGTGTDGTGTNPTAEPTTGDAESSGSTTGAGAVDYVTDIQPIWDLKCVSCHVAGGSAAMGPVLTSDKSYAAIVDVQSPTVALPLVAPGDVDGSYIWHKLNGTQADVGGSGSPMPLGTPLDAADLAKIEQWINDGAKP